MHKSKIYLFLILERFFCIWIGSFWVIALPSDGIELLADVSLLIFFTGKDFLFTRGIDLITGLDVDLDVAEEGLTSLTKGAYYVLTSFSFAYYYSYWALAFPAVFHRDPLVLMLQSKHTDHQLQLSISFELKILLLIFSLCFLFVHGLLQLCDLLLLLCI